MSLFSPEAAINITKLIVGVLLLYKGADYLVDAASATASRLGVRPLIIGMTVIAFGTSMPELSISALAVFGKTPHHGISVGNIVGSNIANILFVLGLSALIRPLKIEKSVVSREIVVMLIASFMLLAMSLNFVLGRIDGIIMLICLIAYLILFVKIAIKESAVDSGTGEAGRSPWWKSLLLMLGGLLGVVVGAKFLIASAVFIAEKAGISEAVIGLSLIAVGTSLPEVAVSCMAAHKNRAGISIGNVIGSNVFNIWLVLGFCAAFATVSITPHALLVDMAIMIAISINIIPMLRTSSTLSRKEGAVLLIGYAVYLTYLFGFGHP